MVLSSRTMNISGWWFDTWTRDDNILCRLCSPFLMLLSQVCSPVDHIQSIVLIQISLTGCIVDVQVCYSLLFRWEGPINLYYHYIPSSIHANQSIDQLIQGWCKSSTTSSTTLIGMSFSLLHSKTIHFIRQSHLPLAIFIAFSTAHAIGQHQHQHQIWKQAFEPFLVKHTRHMAQDDISFTHDNIGETSYNDRFDCANLIH